MQYKRFPLGKLWTNGYLFWDEDGEAFFIDPGGDASEVLKFVKAHNLKLQKVRREIGRASCRERV